VTVLVVGFEGKDCPQTVSLTLHRGAVLVKLTTTQLIEKKIHIFGTQELIAVFTITHQLSLL
jgi:hypothetical protein